MNVKRFYISSPEIPDSSKKRIIKMELILFFLGIWAIVYNEHAKDRKLLKELIEETKEVKFRTGRF